MLESVVMKLNYSSLQHPVDPVELAERGPLPEPTMPGAGLPPARPGGSGGLGCGRGRRGISRRLRGDARRGFPDRCRGTSPSCEGARSWVGTSPLALPMAVSGRQRPRRDRRSRRFGMGRGDRGARPRDPRLGFGTRTTAGWRRSTRLMPPWRSASRPAAPRMSAGDPGRATAGSPPQPRSRAAPGGVSVPVPDVGDESCRTMFVAELQAACGDRHAIERIPSTSRAIPKRATVEDHGTDLDDDTIFFAAALARASRWPTQLGRRNVRTGAYERRA